MDKIYLVYTRIDISETEVPGVNSYDNDDYGTNKRDSDYENYMAFEGEMFKQGSIHYVTPFIWDGKGSRAILAREALVYSKDGKLLKDRYGVTMVNKPDGNVPKFNEDGSYSMSLAQCAYEAYGDHRDWKAYNGEPIPRWSEVKEDIKKAWEHVADAVIENQQKY